MKVIFKRRAGRLLGRSLTVVALAGVIATAALGPASALAGGGTRTATVYASKTDCGSADTNYTEIGSISISRAGDTASVNVSLDGAAPGTYSVELWGHLAGNLCNRNVVFGQLQTDGNGDASGSFSAPIAPSKTSKYFVALGRDEGSFKAYNDTTSFTLR